PLPHTYLSFALFLPCSELASPRCQSRESNASAAAGGDARCPSNESHCSANDCLTPAPTPTPTPSASSPIGLPLTATLAPSAAAALLPPQSAAMAAYLAAAQQNHLLLTNPLAAAASLVQQATHPHKRQQQQQQQQEEEEEATPALDFSRKRASSVGSEEEQEQEQDAEQEQEQAEQLEQEQEAAPLDLSVSTRKRQLTPLLPEHEAPARKLQRTAAGGDYKSPLPPGSWVPPMNPYLAAVAAKSEASKALEKMSEMSRRETPPPSSRTGGGAGAGAGSTGSAAGGGGRHSAWQSHWLNKGADAAKDVFKCVWCKQSFATLALLTTHMKETQHCGVQVPSPSAGSSSNNNNNNSSSNHSNHNATRGTHNASASCGSSSSASSSTSSSCSGGSGGSAKSELNMLIKETMPLPRKLVRGQDVWLGKGAEQTRQILKCMWCGQSFRSLAEMTSHMQETQHYTNIISQEQIISWKSGDERASNGAAGAGVGAGTGNCSSSSAGGHCSAAAATPTVSAVLTCKVCDQAFGTLKELSAHMAQQSHYKDNGGASSCSSSVSPPAAGGAAGAGAGAASKRGRQARQEKRKKSLPVRKLLELERSGGGGAGSSSSSSLDSALKPLRDFAAATKITCEKCGTKIETALFVEHIRKCLGDSIPIPPRRPHNQQEQQQQSRLASPSLATPTSSSSGAPSVLNALEQLIEKSFESRVGRLATGYSEAGTPLGASILKRLGIDDSSDYTKPLMDAQAMQMQLLRSTYPLRDRSASESSSASRVESAYTPDRQQQAPTPRRTPETPTAATLPPPAAAGAAVGAAATVKSEPLEAGEVGGDACEAPANRHLINVKKEFSMEATSVAGAGSGANPRESPGAASERSNSSPHAGAAAGTESGSLLALNSMFDQLSGGVEHNNNNNSGHCFNNNNNNNNNNGSLSSKKPKAHPLAALQKLCETTDPPASNTRSASASSASGAAAAAGAGAGNASDLVAFSWACNEAVLSASAGAELIIKCSFCDTPFGSKGAYRHHLSKVHFVKEAAGVGGGEETPPPQQLKSPAAAQSPKTLPLASPKRAASRSPATQQQQQQQLAQTSPSPSASLYDESPQSKFLKYAELAKQLSSKNA
ncbi:hypothetical protein KR222_006635, partial [Zaprionus bogoriensis]